MRLSPLPAFLNVWKIYFPHVQQKPEGTGEREVSIAELNEIEQQEREQAKEDLDSPEETAHILRGWSTPTAARKAPLHSH